MFRSGGVFGIEIFTTILIHPGVRFRQELFLKRFQCHRIMNESQQLLRQWKLLQMLADSRVGFTLQELVETFEVSLRSIQRDIAVLQSAGFPLEDVTVDRNLKRWKMRPFSEQMGFNFADMISIVMSRRFLEPLAEHHSGKVIRRSIAKSAVL